MSYIPNVPKHVRFIQTHIYSKYTTVTTNGMKHSGKSIPLFFFCINKKTYRINSNNTKKNEIIDNYNTILLDEFLDHFIQFNP